VAITMLPKVRTADLVRGMFFKTGGRWYLANGDAAPRPGSTEDAPAYRIRMYTTDGDLSWLDVYGETVETNAGDKPPESFSQHKLAAHARKLEDDANGMLSRVARIRQFAARLETKEV
jgi:hypothetical protein